VGQEFLKKVLGKGTVESMEDDDDDDDEVQ